MGLEEEPVRSWDALVGLVGFISRLRISGSRWTRSVVFVLSLRR